MRYLWILILAACSKSSSTQAAGTTAFCTDALSTTSFIAPAVTGSTGYNVLQFDIGISSVCNSTANVPCTSVTVCIPGTSQCQTVDNILVDTGSYGLRIFSSVLQKNICQSLTPSKINTSTIGECAQFGSVSLWGAVATADIQLAQEPVISVPIQIINASFASVPSSCGSVPQTPSAAGFNGILGVGLGVADCGSACATSTGYGYYFTCSGSTCTETTLTPGSQVQNPVALLPKDNQGVIMDLTSWNSGRLGAASITGNLVFGINTAINNTIAGKTIYRTDANYDIQTALAGTTITSFIDSGSNAYFLPIQSGLISCANQSGFYCPISDYIATAENISPVSSISSTASFTITSETTLFAQSNYVFNNLGGQGTQFDWGLPFFLGKKIAVCIDGATCGSSTGPLWAY